MLRLAALLVLVAACHAAPPAATAADAARASVPLAELQDGRRLMITKCGNCHAPPNPHEHTVAEWPGKLDEMGERSNLDPRQRHLIQQYFVVMAQR